MCGIAGFAGAGDADALTRMCERLVHRGPDGHGTLKAEGAARPVWLGFRRLAVIDIAGGAQPMPDASGDLAVVFNGEIYNAPALRSELQALGHAFRTDHSDTEVLLHGWHAWGAALVPRLSGMFAFALYDRRRQVLFCARDRVGKKPFFYAQAGDTFVFASEASALFEHPLVPRRVSGADLERYFAWGAIAAPYSLYEGVRKLEPGHTLTYDLRAGTIATAAYWAFAISGDAPPPGTYADWSQEVARLLDAAVARRLQSDVPLGFFLSGGVDSTAVVALARRRVPDVRTFSIGFKEPSFDESAAAAASAAHLGTLHASTIVDLQLLEHEADAVLSAMDEPITDPSLLPTWILSGVARQQVTVALSGDGGDELFAGYDTFPAMRFARVLQMLPASLVRGVAEALPIGYGNMSLDFRLRRAARAAGRSAALWHPLWLAPAAPEELSRLFGRTLRAEDLYADAVALWEGCASPHPVDRAIEYYVRYYLSSGLLTKLDRASMLHSLEVRSPFLDNDLIDFTSRLPHWTKMRGGRRKRILKSALQPLVRPDVLRRPKKGFGIPIADWLRRLPAPDRSRADGLGLDGEWLVRCWSEHRKGDADHRGILWAWHALDRCLTAGARA